MFEAPIRHFENDVIHLQVHIFKSGFLYLKSSLSTYQNMYRFTTNTYTVGELMTVQNMHFFLLSQHFFCIFKCSQLPNGICYNSKPRHTFHRSKMKPSALILLKYQKSYCYVFTKMSLSRIDWLITQPSL